MQRVVILCLLALSLAACSGGDGETAKDGKPTGAGDPQQLVTRFTRHLAGGQIAKACALVNDGGKQAIASSTGQGDCTAALTEVVSDWSPERLAKYQNWTFDQAENLKVTGDTAVFDGYCASTLLHNIKLILTKTGDGWLISGWDDQLGYTCGG